jgi:hypothetical protein
MNTLVPCVQRDHIRICTDVKIRCESYRRLVSHRFETPIETLKNFFQFSRISTAIVYMICIRAKLRALVPHDRHGNLAFGAFCETCADLLPAAKRWSLEFFKRPLSC